MPKPCKAMGSLKSDTFLFLSFSQFWSQTRKPRIRDEEFQSDTPWPPKPRKLKKQREILNVGWSQELTEALTPTHIQNQQKKQLRLHTTFLIIRGFWRIVGKFNFYVVKWLQFLLIFFVQLGVKLISICRDLSWGHCKWWEKNQDKPLVAGSRMVYLSSEASGWNILHD